MGFEPTSYLLSLHGKSSCTEIVCLFLHNHHLLTLHPLAPPGLLADFPGHQDHLPWLLQAADREGGGGTDARSKSEGRHCTQRIWSRPDRSGRSECTNEEMKSRAGGWLAGGSYSLLVFFGKFSCIVTTRELCRYAWLLISSWCSFSA